MKDVEAGSHRLRLNRWFRKAGVNRYTECRVCNFSTRSIIVVNAKCDDVKSYEINGVVNDYLERHKDVKELIGNFSFDSFDKLAKRDRLWVLC